MNHNKSVSASPGTLFLWRTASRYDGVAYAGEAWADIPRVYRGWSKRCPFCKGRYSLVFRPATTWRETKLPQFAQFDIARDLPDYLKAPSYLQEVQRCRICGFMYTLWGEVVGGEGTVFDPNRELVYLRLSALVNLDISSPEVALDELGSHLRRRFSDLRYLRSRTFEKLVADIYREHGYQVILTKQTRDGGYDVVLLETSAENRILVECKRHFKPIGVGMVRQLLGVQLVRGVPKAKLVATTKFTPHAKEEAEKVNRGLSGYEVDLVDADVLFDLLGIYNKVLPALSVDPRFCKPTAGLAKG